MYCGYITTIKGLRKHSNADRLLCFEAFGSNVIVNTDYMDGQRVVFFPIDGQLSEEYATDNNLVRKKDEAGNNIGGYLDPDKRNITALKLRGEKSEGLVMPIETLMKYTDISKLKDGEAITALNGHVICTKYIPRRKNRRGGGSSSKVYNRKEHKETVAYPMFAEHTDTAQLAYNQGAFKSGDTIYITRKLHGTSARTSNALEVTTRKRPNWLKKLFGIDDKVTRKYSAVSGTRRVVLRSCNDGYQDTNRFRKPFHDLLAGRLPKGMTVYYEIVGWVNEYTPIMGRCSNAKVKDKAFAKQYGKETVFTYGCEPGESEMYVYRITMTNEDGVVVELPTEETMRWCERLGVKFVPLLEKFLYTTWEDLNERCDKYLDVPEPLADGAHVVEGVVVRIDNRSRFTAYKKKSFYFKVIEGVIKDEADAPDMEEAQEFADEECIREIVMDA